MIVFYNDNSLWSRKINCVPTRVTMFILWSFWYWKIILHAIIEIPLIFFYPWLAFEIWWGTWFVVLYLGCWFRKPRLGARSVEFGSCEHHVCCTFQVCFFFLFPSHFYLWKIKVLSDFHELYALSLLVTIFTHQRKFHFHYFLHGSKLGVPIKTTVSATVLEEALNGMVIIRPLLLGQPISKKVSYTYSCSAV